MIKSQTLRSHDFKERNAKSSHNELENEQKPGPTLGNTHKHSDLRGI